MKKRKTIITVMLFLLGLVANVSACVAVKEGYLSLLVWFFIIEVLIVLSLKYVLEGRSLYLPHEIKRERKRVAEFEKRIRIFNNETPN